MNDTDVISTDGDPAHPMTQALRKLVEARSLTGAVLLSFTDDRVGVNSSARDDAFGKAMSRLADIVLERFLAGDFDGALDAPAESVTPEAPPTTDAAGWRPIESAPKSTAQGRCIYLLGFCPDEGVSPEACIDVIWWEPQGDSTRPAHGCWYGSQDCQVRVTHWRPLPPPPDAAMAQQVTQGGRNE